MKILYKVIIEGEEKEISQLKTELTTDFIENFKIKNMNSEDAGLITLEFEDITVNFLFNDAIEITTEEERAYKKVKEILKEKTILTPTTITT